MDSQRTGSRLLEACNTCRRRKVKCDRQRPLCAPCAKSRLSCGYTDRIKVTKTPRRRPTKARQFEDRLERVESLLNFPVDVLDKVAKEIMGKQDDAKSLSRSTSREISDAPVTSQSSSQGSSKSTPITLGDSSHEAESHADLSDTNSAACRITARDDPHPPRIFKPLPSREDATSLLDIYFVRFNNSVFPVLHQQTFMQILDDRYAATTHQDLGWWASLNVALAHGSRWRALNSPLAAEEDQSAWGYLENALAVVPSLAIATPSLSSIQALLGMAAFLQGTPIPRSYSLLVATAIRLGHSLGLHRQEAYSGLPPLEIVQRRRVFWLGYILDKDISMRSGQPSIQHDDDIDVELPTESAKDGTGYISLSHSLWPMNFLHLRIQLAIIQGAISKDLYSARAMKQPNDLRQANIDELDQRIKQWKNSTSLEFTPAFLTMMVVEPFNILHIVILYFTYFNCLTLVHRCTFQNMSWKTRSPDSIEPFNPRNFSTKPIVIETARSALHLLTLVPQNNLGFLWLILQFSCSAMITLLRNIELNPTFETAPCDFRLVSPMLGMFCMLARHHMTESMEHDSVELGSARKRNSVFLELVRMRDFCFVLRDRAKLALDAAWIGREGYLGVESSIPGHDLMEHSSQEAVENSIEMDSSEEAAYDGQSLEETFQEKATLSSAPPEYWTSLLSAAEPMSVEAATRLADQELSSYNNLLDGKWTNGALKGKSIDIHGPSSKTVEGSRQDDGGMWNWWDMIDMDIDGNRIVASPN